jgi:hypothetical protein
LHLSLGFLGLNPGTHFKSVVLIVNFESAGWWWWGIFTWEVEDYAIGSREEEEGTGRF